MRGPLKFIDLFCGIGGFRLAFERAGGECVFSSDWNKYAQQTYAANFGGTPLHALRNFFARCSARKAKSGSAASSGKCNGCPA